jgi:hypothetical protein
MLGRKTYTKEELEHGRSVVTKQLAAFRKLAKTAGTEKGAAALEEFEPPFFENMVLALDRPFVHRLRMSTGKDGNALNEVELICDSLINNNGVLRGNNVIKYVPQEAVVKLELGDQIRLTAKDFENLSTAFFEELEHRFAE